MYDRLKVEFQGVQQVFQSSRVVSTKPLSSEEPELGDELAQICRLVDVVEAHLRRTQEEAKQATRP
jgi:hypothetical protein